MIQTRRDCPRISRAAAHTLGLSLLFFAGCDSGADTAREPTPELRSDGPDAGASLASVPLAVSINAVMVGLVDHGAHSIWDAAVEETAPRTDEDWEEVMHHAIQLVAAATTISRGGTGQFDEEWVRQPVWQSFATSLRDTGLEALDAVDRQDSQAIMEAGDHLIEVCEGCHAEFKPALPTEGLLHDRH